MGLFKVVRVYEGFWVHKGIEGFIRVLGSEFRGFKGLEILGL